MKNGKIWENFEKYFLPRKTKNGKKKEKSAGIWGKWKNLVKSVKNGKIW